MSSKARGNQGGAMDRRQVLGIMISLSVLPLAACKTGGVHVAVGNAALQDGFIPNKFFMLATSPSSTQQVVATEKCGDRNSVMLPSQAKSDDSSR
jgi:hypothetical protein